MPKETVPWSINDFAGHDETLWGKMQGWSVCRVRHDAPFSLAKLVGEWQESTALFPK